jgi:hypothetical protein
MATTVPDAPQVAAPQPGHRTPTVTYPAGPVLA